MAGIQYVIKDVNGLIKNPVRYAQLKRVCELYNVEVLYPIPLNYNSAYLSGLIDTDGSVYFNKKSMQAFITISQKALAQRITRYFSTNLWRCCQIFK